MRLSVWPHYEVRVGAVAVRLPDQEGLVLAALLQAEEVSRETVREVLWPDPDCEPDGWDSAIRAVISKLRPKLARFGYGIKSRRGFRCWRLVETGRPGAARRYHARVAPMPPRVGRCAATYCPSIDRDWEREMAVLLRRRRLELFMSTKVVPNPYSQTEIGRRIGASKAMVSRWESGRMMPPSWRMRAAWANALGLSFRIELDEVTAERERAA